MSAQAPRSSQGSLQGSLQETTGIPYTDGAPSVARLPVRTNRRLILLREHDPAADLSPTPKALQALLDAVTTRDVAILSALDSYRYLDRGQLQRLFFNSIRPSQKRVNWLRRLHLIRRWMALEPPGWHRRDSVLVLSSRGARLLATANADSPRPAIHRSLKARDHSTFLVHDLEANGFFVRVAAAAARVADQGLYHWVGEGTCRERFVEWSCEVTPDGWGRYLTPEGEVIFMLEWDRATESPKRLRTKLRGYVRCFAGGRDAHLNHVLVVAPTAEREHVVHQAIADVAPRAASAASCRFWTTSNELLGDRGHLGRIWADPGGDMRLGLASLSKRPRSERRVDDCIAKPRWWERRPAGGEGA